jgi:hypothetical protein
MQRILASIGALVPIVAGVLYFGTAGRPPSGGSTPAAMLRAERAVQPEVVPAGGFSDASPTSAKPVLMLVTVSSRCELRAVADGRVIVARDVRAGELFQFEFGQDVALSGDNAGAIQFSINGRAGRTLGAAGEPLSARIGRDDYDSLLIRP